MAWARVGAALYARQNVGYGSHAVGTADTAGFIAQTQGTTLGHSALDAVIGYALLQSPEEVVVGDTYEVTGTVAVGTRDGLYPSASLLPSEGLEPMGSSGGGTHGADVFEASETGKPRVGTRASGADAHDAIRAGQARTGRRASGADAHDAIRAGSARTGRRVSGSDSHENVEAGSARAGTRTSGADVREAVESGQARTGRRASGADVFTATETGQARLDTQASGADVHEAVESGSARAGTRASGTSAKVVGGIEYVKAGQARVGTRASGADVHEAVEAGSARLDTRVSGTTGVVVGSVHSGGGFNLSAPTVSVTGGTDQLYLVCAALRTTVDDWVSMSGGGLTWAELDDQLSGRSQYSADVWWAYGTPSSDPFTLTATASDATGTRILHVVRLVGANNQAPTVVSVNTNGVNGAGTLGTDNASPTCSVTATQTTSVIVSFCCNREGATPITYDGDYDDLPPTYSTQGATLNEIGMSTAYRTSPPLGADTIGHSLAAVSDWVMFGAEVVKAVAPVTYEKTGSARVGTRASGASEHVSAPVTYEKAGQALVGTQASAAEALELSETGSAMLAARASGVATEVAGVTYEKAGTARVGTRASAADQFTASESGLVRVGTRLSGADAFTATETGKVLVDTQVSGADVRHAVETGSARTRARVSASVEHPHLAYEKTGTLIVGTRASGTSAGSILGRNTPPVDAVAGGARGAAGSAGAIGARGSAGAATSGGARGAPTAAGVVS